MFDNNPPKQPSQEAPLGSFVYFVGAVGGPIKIGCSIRPRERRSVLQVGSEHSLQVLAMMPGDRATEAAMHQRFAGNRIRGEMFAPSPDLLMLIWTLASGKDRSAVGVLDDPHTIGVHGFLERRTIKGIGLRVRSSALFSAYARECANAVCRPVSQKQFSEILRRSGFDRIRSNGIYWLDMRLREAAHG